MLDWSMDWIQTLRQIHSTPKSVVAARNLWELLAISILWDQPSLVPFYQDARQMPFVNHQQLGCSISTACCQLLNTQCRNIEPLTKKKKEFSTDWNKWKTESAVYRCLQKKPTGHRHLPISGPFQNRLRASVAVPLCGDVPVPGLAKIATPKSPVTKVCPGWSLLMFGICHVVEDWRMQTIWVFTLFLRFWSQEYIFPGDPNHWFWRLGH